MMQGVFKADAVFLDVFPHQISQGNFSEPLCLDFHQVIPAKETPKEKIHDF